MIDAMRQRIARFFRRLAYAFDGTDPVQRAEISGRWLTLSNRAHNRYVLTVESHVADLQAAIRDHAGAYADTILETLAQKYQRRLDLGFTLLKQSAPVEMVLRCPRCKRQHVDMGEWATKKHRVHACQFCAHEWRPFNYNTVGIR